jgi:imidazolonepropionase-like amidohydrolase
MQKTATLSSIARAILGGLCAATLLAAPILGQEKAKALHCGKIYIGNGQVMTDVYLVVKNGKVDRLTRTRPKDMTIVDASDKVVMPGIVAADTNLTTPRDSAYNVTPDFVALEGFDFLGNYNRPLSGGVTTVYISPGRQRFISGQGSVVKLHGKDIVRRVLKESACLRLTLGKEASNSPMLFEPTPHPTSDNPLTPARKQFPSARISQLNELRRVFRMAQAKGAKVQGKGSAEERYDVTALKNAASGKLMLRIAAKEAPDIRNAIRFAKELGASLVLESPYEIQKTLAIHEGAPLSAVFRLSVRPGQSNTGGENRRDKSARNLPENAVFAAKNGTRIAIAPGNDNDLQDYLLIAGLVIRLGLTEKQALSAITLDAAKLLGVDARVGSLEPGKDADFLVLSGDPFGVGTLVEDTFVDGNHAYHREKSSEVLVVKAGRIITLEGQAIDNGVITVSGGKIKGIGKDPTIPPGARVIDLSNSVIVPGFVDAYCHAGLSGDGTGIPMGKASHRLTEVIQYDDPVFKKLVEAGLTTVFVSGRDSGLVSGRVAAVKTGATDKKGMILKDIAGIRFVHDNITPGSIKSVESQINRAKAYIAKWKKYEKDLADWKAGKKKKVEKKIEPVKSEKKKEMDKISGTWEIPPLEGLGFPVGFQLDLKLNDDNTLTGTVQMSFRGRLMGDKSPIQDGKYDKGEFSFSMTGGVGGQTSFKGKVEDDTLVGTVSMQGRRGAREGEFVATRMSGEPSERSSSGDGSIRRSKKPKDGRPQKPSIDDNLEPMKALLEKKIPAIINTTRAPAITEIVSWFEKNKLPYILHGAQDAVDTPEILGDHKPGFLFTPNFLTRKGKRVRNKAAKISESGIPVGLVSGDTEGSRYLPLHAALAVRYGMDPTEALKAITLYPARMFKLDHRIGSLKRGKDADFVVFSGNPLEMTSRVQLVVVNGKVVVDNRQKGEKK